jgi:hypothetical protein
MFVSVYLLLNYVHIKLTLLSCFFCGRGHRSLRSIHRLYEHSKNRGFVFNIIYALCERMVLSRNTQVFVYVVVERMNLHFTNILTNVNNILKTTKQIPTKNTHTLVQAIGLCHCLNVSQLYCKFIHLRIHITVLKTLTN